MRSSRKALGPLSCCMLILVAGVYTPARAEPSTTPDPRASENALAGLDVADGLSATLFAAEPMVRSISNIDVDHRGRVWVCDVVNYRGRRGERPEGDRILILEDADGDGSADRQTVYYQGRDIDAALGICVLGKKVIVSCSPNVFVFTDENGDDRPDRKEILFTNTGQEQNDHSAHAFVFGPDGKLYWNFGNAGKEVCDKEGRRIVDLSGNEVVDNGRPYFGGMVFRCNAQGEDFEVLAHNFRNIYEVAVDAFGTLWQSDNDDDGNRGVRINYVMEYGNYGYRDEMTGAGWRTPRVGMHPQVPQRHWHQNDPGVVPNLLVTGAGSPAGISVYEGRLLPQIFWDQLIHADAGPNVVRAYPVTKSGAGFQATTVNILKGTRDQWFRPADVCVAPDGSLFIADWYDPGVGGNRMGDVDRGRIFRIAPPETPYRVPSFDFADPKAAVAALVNPAQAVRYLAWQALARLHRQAEPHLLPLLNSKNQRHRARALWLLSNVSSRGKFFAQYAVDDSEPDIRVLGLRIARSRNLDVTAFIRQLLDDQSPHVRRECAIALRHSESPEAAELWAELAYQHDGRDRWYLEALGIAADRRWDPFLDAWLNKVGEDWNTPAGRDIIWRSRGAKTAEYLARLVVDPSLPSEELPRMLRALDFVPDAGVNDILARLVFNENPSDRGRSTLIVTEAIRRLQPFDLQEQPKYKIALMRVLDDVRGTGSFVELVQKFNVSSKYADLLALAQQKPADRVGVQAIRALLAKRQIALIRDALDSSDAKATLGTLQALGNSADGRSASLLLPLLDDAKRDIELRREAARAVAKTRNGARRLIERFKSGNLDPSLQQATAAALHSATWKEVKEQAAELFPLPAAGNNKPLPPIAKLLEMRGDEIKGKIVFNTTGTCTTCHVVDGTGKEVGPDLSEIGDKLDRQALYESILFPSAAVGHNYETYVVVSSSGNVINGVITSRTADAITIKGADAIARTFKTSEIDAIEKQSVSLMPADLQKVMTAEELVDVVQYMSTLRKAASQ